MTTSSTPKGDHVKSIQPKPQSGTFKSFAALAAAIQQADVQAADALRKGSKP